MIDILVDKIRSENYLLEIFQLTKNAEYVKSAKEIIAFVKDVYRSIEPSHYRGKLAVFKSLDNTFSFIKDSQETFYDKGILNHNYSSLIFQIRNNEELPIIWTDVDNLPNLLYTEYNFIAYLFENNEEYFIVNRQRIPIQNRFSCPSIFALQYHHLNEALLDYKNKRVRMVSCEHFKKCWADKKWIYFKNKPESCMQVSLSEFLKNSVRGVNVVREYNLGATKPVDVRVYWREANRAALIELKWVGQSLKEDNTLGTPYSNGRANDGMKQIKDYIDLNNSDSPSVITKGYLIVIDGRRWKIGTNKVSFISKENGMHYANKNLEIDENKQYWRIFFNIEKPIRMFVEPICEM